MRKITIVVFILLISSTIIPQELSRNELDSLYNLFTFVRGINPSDKMQQILDENPGEKKCGLGLVTAVKQNLNSFSLEQQSVLSKLLDRPILPNTAVSPNGFFRVHYTTTGPDAIGYDLNLLLSALDSAYNFEINFLGYPSPPTDGSAGGDEKYDIYVQDLARLYGYTQPENKVNPTNWTSYLVIDNDFPSGFYYTQGINAARVTVAHEFHHAIQMGNYAPINPSEPFRNSDRFFYEITSTAFEEFVFDDVNDYYAYMPSYFQNPETPMSLNDGYNLAIWNIFLQNNFGFEIIKNQWEQIPTKSALEVIALSIFQEGSTLGNELNKFGIWTYFTNSRDIPGRYFEEAGSYPLINPTATVSFSPPSDTYDMTIAPVANYFLKVNLPSSDGVFFSIITNSDYQKTPNQTFPFSFSIFQDTVSGARIISENYSVTFSNDTMNFWNNAGILNDDVAYGGSKHNVVGFNGDTRVFPNPYKSSFIDGVTFEIKTELFSGSEVDVSIFSTGLELYYSSKKKLAPYENQIKRIPINKSEIDFPSGVYIYIIKAGDDIYKGKLVIFND